MQYGNTGSYHININYQENVALNVIYFQYACILFIGLKLIIYVYHLIKYLLFMDRRKCFFFVRTTNHSNLYWPKMDHANAHCKY